MIPTVFAEVVVLGLGSTTFIRELYFGWNSASIFKVDKISVARFLKKCPFLVIILLSNEVSIYDNNPSVAPHI